MIPPILADYQPKQIKAYGEKFIVEPSSKASTTSIPKKEDHNQELFFNTIKRGMRI